MLKRCVYTAFIGGYERLNEPEIARESSLPFICFTDDPDLRSDFWQIQVVQPTFPMDPIRSQRDIKIRPHLYLPEFDQSLYIDNTVRLSVVPEKLFDAFLGQATFALPTHSFRENILDEFVEVARNGLDNSARLFEQVNHYLLTDPKALDERPYWNAILFRDHRDEKVRRALEIWFSHVLRYSRRDQLSIIPALHAVGLSPLRLEIDNHSSWFHTWPHAENRDRNKGMRDVGASLAPAVFRLRQVEQALDQAKQALEAERGRSDRLQQALDEAWRRYAILRKRSILRLPRWLVRQERSGAPLT